LTLADVKIAKLFDKITVTPNGLRHQVTAALIRNTNGFILEKPSDCVFVTGQ
jgi:hypothetical protein